uniref:ATP synthase subunit a n=1 Tax=Leiolepis reevesii TaxID=143513 RepID=A0A059UGL2_9SAUR|nr:ATP synthase F0 subunit 6 [Leiolepis reevesii]AHZ61477.1 ATP synthase F0 subunit 6 [Leiolepis reevesii]
MMTNLFDQFMTPKMFGMQLLPLTLLIAPMITFVKSDRLHNNRFVTLSHWAMKTITKHTMTPINKPGHNWAPILISLILLLLTMNVIGLLPYTFTPTTQLSMNMALALPLWLATVLIGLRTQTTSSLAHLLPIGTPTPLIPTLVLIETVSLIIRPLALGVRLTANLTAGHLLLHLISTATMNLTLLLPIISPLSMTILMLLTILEVAVALIQAYVFTLLLSLYLQENT